MRHNRLMSSSHRRPDGPSPHDTAAPSTPAASRRAVLAGLGATAVALTACSTSGSAPEAAPAPTDGPLAKVADVPVGSGVVVGSGADGVVVTQPSAGVFKGFSPVCPHAGCSVSKVAGGSIVCPCHGSRFSLEGAVLDGPATKPLTPKPVAVQGDSIVAG